jgi:ABC-2 type transport system ATP-binding protein
MSAAVQATGLGKRYGRHWALQDCSFTLPSGTVAGLVGPNGAGKTTLLHLTVGLLEPTEGAISVLGSARRSKPEALSRIGFVAQETPLYGGFTVAEMLRLGTRLNPRFDETMARTRLAQLEIPPERRIAHLSGGQRAQVALALALAKRPELLLLDEPVASLDPLARRTFLQTLMDAVAETGTTVLLSSHLINDLERICDYLLLLSASHIQVAGSVEDLLAAHRFLTGPRRDPATVPAGLTIVHARHTGRQTTLLVRSTTPVHDPSWTVHDVSLEQLVLAYMGAPGEGALPGPARPSQARTPSPETGESEIKP